MDPESKLRSGSPESLEIQKSLRYPVPVGSDQALVMDHIARRHPQKGPLNNTSLINHLADLQGKIIFREDLQS